MEDDHTTKEEGLKVTATPKSPTVAVAINGKRKSKYVVGWALDKFVAEGIVSFKLLHIRPKIDAVPTPMGNLIPTSQVRADLVDAFKKETEWQALGKLQPYKLQFIKRKVEVEIILTESDDIVNAISEEVIKYNINRLVIGASSRSLFSWGRSLSSRISESCPGFCTIYAVSKGMLSSLRPSDSDMNRSSSVDDCDLNISRSHSLPDPSSSRTSEVDREQIASYTHFRSPSLPLQRFHALSNINQTLLNRNQTIRHKTSSVDTGEAEVDRDSWPPNLGTAHASSPTSSFRSYTSDGRSWTNDQASTSDVPTDLSSSSEININFELAKLRLDLRNIRGMYAQTQSEAIDASRKLNDLHKRRSEEAAKLSEITLKEEQAKALAKLEREKYEVAKREADYAKECAEREAAQRREAETKALREAQEKERLENALTGHVQQYQDFTWEEIVSATSSFSEDLRIGMGAYGTVYKCSLHHTTVAVKILHSKEANWTKQFQQELDILSKIRHPHLLILLGACPDQGCLVYEYMENGSLEDRLLRKNNTPPIPWFERFRISGEIASALAFLHSSKPKPIIHRDLKPANILLDRNLVSKIGDVGLSTMLHSESLSLSTTCKDTGPVGTLCYMDPEYQRTGLISPKSDVYAFGMVILQLLTAKPAIALTHVVETAIEDGKLMEILDPEAGKWPIEETKALADLALKCTEIRRRDRPDLKDHVLPVLEKLKEVADKAGESSSARPAPPNYFICPILKDVMYDPCVAADGYTYDRGAIETWLKDTDKSPMTNLPLPHRNLVPNYTLLSAIIGWKSGKH